MIHACQPETSGAYLMATDSGSGARFGNCAIDMSECILEASSQQVRPSTEGLANDPASGIDDHGVSLGAPAVDSQKISVFTHHWFVDLKRSSTISPDDRRSVNDQYLGHHYFLLPAESSNGANGNRFGDAFRVNVFSRHRFHSGSGLSSGNRGPCLHG